MKAPIRILLPAAIALALTAAAAISFARGGGRAEAGGLAIVSAWARATPPGATTGAAYVTVENRAGPEDRLISAESAAARSVTLHQTVEENGVATMRPLDNTLVPAGGRLEMRPGGAHLMLSELTAPLKEGETIPMTLTFARAGAVSITIEVAPIGAVAPVRHDHAM